MSDLTPIKYKKNAIVCTAGEENYDLYIVEKGKLLVFVNNGNEITPLSYIGQGEYLGEIAFFDEHPRSAHAICLEDTTLARIPVTELDRFMPDWLVTIAKSIAKRVRHSDELIRVKGLKRKDAKTIAPLSPEEQKAIHKLLTQHLASKKNQ